MTAPLWQSEFPNYEPADMPIIPASWEDTSWHNDVCPSFDTRKGLSVFVDYADPAAREMECERFTVSEIGPDGCHLVENQGALLATDDWQAVLDFVASYVPPAKAEAPAPVIPQAGNLDALSQELATYSEQNGLALACAYEMHNDAMRRRDVAKLQCVWLKGFIDRWEAEEARIAREERGPISPIPYTAENVDKLARGFVAECLKSFAAHEMAAIRRKNREYLDEGTTGLCATHDFADANMIMDAAFREVFGRGVALLCEGSTEAEIEADCHIWNAAWAIATTRDLTAPDEATRAAAIQARDALKAHMVETFGPDEATHRETVFWAPYAALVAALS